MAASTASRRCGGTGRPGSSRWRRATPRCPRWCSSGRLSPTNSWVTAAGAVLDAASLITSTVDVPRNVQAEFCIRAGYLALRRIADFFGIPYDRDPKRGDPVTIGRDEFDEACDRLARAGVPLKPDRDECWLDFAGWRVNYDTVLVAMAGLTMAPYAPWSSDRSLRAWRPRLFQPRAKAVRPPR